MSWEPTSYSSTTHITTKISYSEASSKGYEAEALTITVHGTLLDSLSEYWDTSTTNYDPDYKITTNDMWEYYYDADIQVFVFTNKVPIEAGNTFSGYFEITWEAATTYLSKPIWSFRMETPLITKIPRLIMAVLEA